MIRRLIVSLSLVPVLCFGEESAALRHSVDLIHDLCGDILADTSSIDSSLYDAVAYTMEINSTCYSINSNLFYFVNRFDDFSSSELQYSEDTYYAVANLESYLLTIQDEIQNNLVPYVQQMGLDISGLLSHFDALKTEFHSYSVQVLQRLVSIDSNVAEILNAITNGANGVTYDFSVLTNGFPVLSRNLVYNGFIRFLTTSTSDYQNFNFANLALRSSVSVPVSGYSDYAGWMYNVNEELYKIEALGRIQQRPLVQTAVMTTYATNYLGRLVVQGNTVTNCLQWSTNYFAAILSPLVSEIGTNTADIAECQRVITNLLADISSRISSVTNGSDEAEAKVEAEVTKAEEGLESVEKPPDPEGFEFQMFQVNGHENFISSIPEGDTLPAVLHFDFEYQEEHHHFEVNVFSYANVFALFRLAFTAMYWGVTFFVLLYLTRQVYSLVRWLVSMFGGGTSAG